MNEVSKGFKIFQCMSNTNL